MKRIIFIIIMLNSFILFSQEQERIVSSLFSNAGGDFSWYFSKNYIEISTYSDDTGLKKEKFPYSYENKGPYYNLLIHKKDKTEEYVTLMAPHKEFFLAYTNNKISPIELGLFGKNSLLFFGKTKYSTKNYLTEGKIKYVPENLSNLSIGKPWVEGSDGSGIGDKIFISKSSPIKSIVISNGFVSYKVQTYYNNNRVKLLKICNINQRNESITVELPDNAIPFEIQIPFCTRDIELEILDVYKGEKYDDTCINFILCKSDY